MPGLHQLLQSQPTDQQMLVIAAAAAGIGALGDDDEIGEQLADVEWCLLQQHCMQIALDGALQAGREAHQRALGPGLLQHTTRLLQGLQVVLALPAGGGGRQVQQEEQKALWDAQAGLVLSGLELVAVLLPDMSEAEGQPLLVAALPLLPAAFGCL